MIAALLYLQFHTVKNRLTIAVQAAQAAEISFRRAGRRAFISTGIFPGAARSAPACGRIFHGCDSFSGGFIVLRIHRRVGFFCVHRAGMGVAAQTRGAGVHQRRKWRFFFPAPVTRRTLIHFKLMRSQMGILFSALFLDAAFQPLRCERPLVDACGRLVGDSLHVEPAYPRGVLLNHDADGSRYLELERRLAVLLPVIRTGGACGLRVGREFPQLTSADLTNFDTIKTYAQQAFASGPLPYLLFPFELVRPALLATNWFAFLVALGPALLVMLLHYLWVIRSDVAFEEAVRGSIAKTCGKARRRARRQLAQRR